MCNKVLMMPSCQSVCCTACNRRSAAQRWRRKHVQNRSLHVPILCSHKEYILARIIYSNSADLNATDLLTPPTPRVWPRTLDRSDMNALRKYTLCSQYRRLAILRWKGEKIREKNQTTCAEMPILGPRIKKDTLGCDAQTISRHVAPQPIESTQAYRQTAISRWKRKRVEQVARSKSGIATPHRQTKRKGKGNVPDSTTLGRGLLDDIPTKPGLLGAQRDCPYCHAKRFMHEPKAMCCSRGGVSLSANTLPTALKDLLLGETPESKKYRSCIRAYNNHLAFTSFGVEAESDLSQRYNGIYTFRAQGQVYHWINSLTGTAEHTSNLQFYFHDTEYEAATRVQNCPHLFEMTVDKILTVLLDNPYARFFRSLRHIPDLENHEILLYCNPKVDQRVYNRPTVSQVAAILVMFVWFGLAVLVHIFHSRAKGLGGSGWALKL